MPAVGDYRNRFNRNYVWVIPTDLGPGTWRLTADDDADTPGPAPGTNYFQATVDSGTPTILAGQLVYINSAGMLLWHRLAQLLRVDQLAWQSTLQRLML